MGDSAAVTPAAQGAADVVEQAILGYGDFLASHALGVAAGTQRAREAIARVRQLGAKLALRAELTPEQRRRVRVMTFLTLHQLDPRYGDDSGTA